MQGYEIGEVISLGFDLLLLPVLVIILLRGEVPRFGLFVAGAVFILVSHTATVLEGYFFPRTLNVIEHFSILISGVFFLSGFIKYSLIRGGKKQ